MDHWRANDHRPGARKRAGVVAARRLLLGVALLVVAPLVPSFSDAHAAEVDPAPEVPLDAPWVGIGDDGNEVVEVYFVFSGTCPHCQAALPFVDELDRDNDWVRVWWIRTDVDDPVGHELAMAVASELGAPIRAVPTFMYCGQMRSGYDGPEGVGSEIVADLEACRSSLAEGSAATTTTVADVAVAIPGVGDLRSSSVPLPVFTVLVAGLDAFNPCAFFVLLFLLSLLVHARNRTRMAIIGVVFVAMSGLLYFVFLAAWLNLFLVTDNLRWVTLAAGGLAVVLGTISAKDYFASGAGPSTSIPDSAKPGLYARTRRLVSAEHMVPVVGATVALAVVANSYELLCTAGLPMAFTRVLTLNELPMPAYYSYLALYVAVYVVPLLAIVGGFVWTLGSRKLQPGEGRTLKLLSGSMMLGLGIVLRLAPHLLEQVGTAVLVVGGAVTVTIVVVLFDLLFGRATSALNRPQ
ncbi:MAG: thioredoxin family protein [Acidimicrobiia bacterium]